MATWVRPHLPAEFAQALKPLAKYLGKEAAWPMREDGHKAIRAIKLMTCSLIVLQALDERAAADGTRPPRAGSRLEPPRVGRCLAAA